jgi:two-component system CheB/CheR fusion protein
VQIFATDIDHQAIAMARRGVYPEGIAATVSADRLSRFFTRDNASYRIDKTI